MPRAIEYARLLTEQPHSRSHRLDQLSVQQLLRVMNREEATVTRAVSRAIPKIERVVTLLLRTLRRGGRIVFMGAGASGRLGVLEAAECPPTFNTPPRMIQAIMAGGRRAVFRSQEGAEDHRAQARRAILQRVQRGDTVIGIAASGLTPFVTSGLRAAKARGASTVLIACHPEGCLHREVDVQITATVGPELIAGSTRLKAGTATKRILNMLTVATMVRLGKVYGPWMVDVRPTSRKLRLRAVRIIQALTGASAPRAVHLLREARGEVKLAIVMGARGVTSREAKRLLTRHRGFLRPLLL